MKVKVERQRKITIVKVKVEKQWKKTRTLKVEKNNNNIASGETIEEENSSLDENGASRTNMNWCASRQLGSLWEIPEPTRIRQVNEIDQNTLGSFYNI